jgi:hypothetical protein
MLGRGAGAFAHRLLDAVVRGADSRRSEADTFEPWEQRSVVLGWTIYPDPFRGVPDSGGVSVGVEVLVIDPEGERFQQMMEAAFSVEAQRICAATTVGVLVVVLGDMIEID